MALKYVIAATGAFALMSTVAFAQTADTTIVTKTGPNGVGYSKTITKEGVNEDGDAVTSKKTITEGVSGTSVEQTRTVTDPDRETTTRTTTTTTTTR